MSSIIGVGIVITTLFTLFFIKMKSKSCQDKFNSFKDAEEIKLLNLSEPIQITKNNLEDKLIDLVKIIETHKLERPYIYKLDAGLIQTIKIDSILDDFIFLDINNIEILRMKGVESYTVFSQFLPESSPYLVTSEKILNQKIKPKKEISTIKETENKEGYEKNEIDFIIGAAKTAIKIKNEENKKG